MGTRPNFGIAITEYYKTFSGTDTLAFIMMPGCTPVLLGSLTTISYSMYRNKKPVINIGRTNINGVTRGSRIFAGTMVFTLINQHWLREIQKEVDYIKNFKELKVDELPLFDIMIVSANEYGNAVSMYIFGIDFTDEAQTISVEDLFTENVFSFVARDISTFKKISRKSQVEQGSSLGGNALNQPSQRIYVLPNSKVSIDEIAEMELEKTQAKIKDAQKREYKHLARDLYYNPSKVLMGDDVSKVQEDLSKLYPSIEVNGIFDEDMDKDIRDIQSNLGLDVDGIVNDRFYNFVVNQMNYEGHRTGIVVNKSGATVYREMTQSSNIVDVIAYKTQVELIGIDSSDIDGYFQRYYITNNGYVMEEDIYSSYYTGNIIEFPMIQYEESNAYVTLIQNALEEIFNDYNSNFTSTYDDETIKFIKKLQAKYGLEPNGEMNMSTWQLLQSFSGIVNKTLSDDNFEIKYNIMPGIYRVEEGTISEKINEIFINVYCNNPINLKFSAIAKYPNKQTKTLTKTITYDEQQQWAEYGLDMFHNVFLYDINMGCSPSQVDFVVYPNNKRPMKWSLKL